MSELAQEWTQLLKQIPFLAPLPDSVLHDKLVLGKIPQAEVPASLVEIPQGDYAVREGEFGDTFYVVLSGSFGVEVWNDDGVPVQVATIERGAWFGELAMIGKGMRTASVKALTPKAQVLELNKGPFDRMLKEDKTGAVKKTLDELYSRRTLEKFIRDNEYLRELGDADKKALIDNGKLLRFDAMSDVYKTGEPPKSFFLVRQGFLKVWRTEGELSLIHI